MLVTLLLQVRYEGLLSPAPFTRRLGIIYLCKVQNFVLFSSFVGLSQYTIFGPPPATFWAERCGQDGLGGRALRPRVRLVKTLSFVIQGQVRLRYFLGRALRLGWARGPSAAATLSTPIGSQIRIVLYSRSRKLWYRSTSLNQYLSVFYVA